MITKVIRYKLPDGTEHETLHKAEIALHSRVCDLLDQRITQATRETRHELNRAAQTSLISKTLPDLEAAKQLYADLHKLLGGEEEEESDDA